MAEPILDLLVLDSHDPRLLVIADISTYVDGATPISPTLAVTAPGYDEKQIPFVVSTVQMFNSNTLGIPCHTNGCPPVVLPDGIYTFKYAIFPAYKFNVTKTFLRVDRLYQKFDEKFLSVEMFQCDDQTRRERRMLIDNAEYFIQGAIAAANRCANKMAIDLYQKADKLLDSINP